MLSKEEYLTHLDYGVKTCPAIYDAFKELIENNFELIDRCNELERTIYSLDCELSDVYNPKPYKFEDLYEGMWVWDDIEKLICQIELISKNAIHRKYIDGTISDSPFEENRFFPAQCANLES